MHEIKKIHHIATFLEESVTQDRVCTLLFVVI